MAEEKKNSLVWSLQKIKEAFTEKPVSRAEHASNLIDMSVALSVAVKKVFFEKSRTMFSEDPVIQKKGIVAFSGRLRIDAMEKFNQTTIMSVVHYFLNQEDLDKNKPVGLLIIYLERSYVPEMLRLLQYPYIEFDDDRDVTDGSGAIINLIAGHFKNELKALGYEDLEMSHFQSFINKVPMGVVYPKGQTDRYELSFVIDGEKRLVVEMVMAPLVKKSA